jgi:hypothetical protein
MEYCYNDLSAWVVLHWLMDRCDVILMIILGVVLVNSLRMMTYWCTHSNKFTTPNTATTWPSRTVKCSTIYIYIYIILAISILRLHQRRPLEIASKTGSLLLRPWLGKSHRMLQVPERVWWLSVKYRTFLLSFKNVWKLFLTYPRTITKDIVYYTYSQTQLYLCIST